MTATTTTIDVLSGLLASVAANEAVRCCEGMVSKVRRAREALRAARGCKRAENAARNVDAAITQISLAIEDFAQVELVLDDSTQSTSAWRYGSPVATVCESRRAFQPKTNLRWEVYGYGANRGFWFGSSAARDAEGSAMLARRIQRKLDDIAALAKEPVTLSIGSARDFIRSKARSYNAESVQILKSWEGKLDGIPIVFVDCLMTIGGKTESVMEWTVWLETMPDCAPFLYGEW